MKLNMHLIVLCFIFAMLTGTSSLSVNDFPSTSSHAQPTQVSKYIPDRYNRYIFFFFSRNITYTFFNQTILKALINMDNYCGGENLGISAFFGKNKPFSQYETCEFCTLQEYSRVFSNVDFYFFNISHNISGSVDHFDVELSETLINITRYQWAFSAEQKEAVASQVILVTDYVTDSLARKNTTDVLNRLRTGNNIKFIALTTNLTDKLLGSTYFPNDLWTVYPNYTNWAAERQTVNPICNNGTNPHTTPSSSFSHGFVLYIYVLLSCDYVNRTRLTDLAVLLSKLNIRRWQYPCRQSRHVRIRFMIPYHNIFLEYADWNNLTCFLEEQAVHLPGMPTFCTVDAINLAFNQSDWLDSLESVDCANSIFLKFLSAFLHESSLETNKYLLITDVKFPCRSYTATVSDVLSKYNDYKSGAPLSIVVIDKENDKNMLDFYSPFFPETQRSNLYIIKDINEMNMNKSINFCLDSLPWLSQRKIMEHHATFWYFYVIGATILTAFLLIFLIFILRRNKKRREMLKQIRDRIEIINSASATSRNHHEFTTTPTTLKDMWEVSIESMDIDYKMYIGKGTFSVVHSGFLHGKAPVLKIFPSIALQEFADCDVAVKTLPHHCNDNDRELFLNEIQLMKDIGYHNHLVSMVGCNCTIERPILLLELAKQNLSNWLTETRSSVETIARHQLNKTLQSIAWQVSDGMCYLSTKNFIHRDLAARNVLLSSEMKAMIGDFGLCQKLKNGEQVRTIAGGRLPVKWMALESLQEHQFSIKTDIFIVWNLINVFGSWSFGVLLFEIFSLGKEPYEKITGGNLIVFLLDGNRLDQPRFADEQLYDLMKLCWHVEPPQRPTFASIKSYFAGLLEDSAANYGYLTVENEIEEEEELA